MRRLESYWGHACSICDSRLSTCVGGLFRALPRMSRWGHPRPGCALRCARSCLAILKRRDLGLAEECPACCWGWLRTLDPRGRDAGKSEHRISAGLSPGNEVPASERCRGRSSGLKGLQGLLHRQRLADFGRFSFPACSETSRYVRPELIGLVENAGPRSG